MFNKLLVTAGLIATSAFSFAGDNLVKNGDFTQLEDNGYIKGWKKAHKAKVITSEDNQTLLLKGGHASIAQKIKLESNWAALHLSMKMKASNITPGKAGWEDGRLAMYFEDANGKRVGKWPKVFNAKGTTEWLDCERDYEIPDGAVALKISAVNFGKTGNLEFRDIKITVKK